MHSLTRLLSAAFLALALVVPTSAETPARKDALGDPLPDGAVMRLGTSRFRVMGVACLAPNGQRIAVSGQRSLRLLNAADGSQVWRIATDQPNTSDLVFSPAGDVFITSCYDGSIRIWATATGEAVGRIDSRQKSINSITFAPDGKSLVIAPPGLNQKAVLRAYAVPGGKEIATYEPVHDNAIGVAFSPDGKTMASWGSLQFRQPVDQHEALKLSQTVQLWDVAGGKEARRLETDCGPVSSAVYTPDGQTLVLAVGAGGVQFWDPARIKLLQTFRGRPGYDHRLFCTPDGKTLLSYGADGWFQAWNLPSGRRITTAAPPPGWVGSLAFPAEGKILAGIQDGAQLRLWDVLSGKAVVPDLGHSRPAGALAFTADGQTLRSAGPDGFIIRWDAAAGKELGRIAVAPAADFGRRRHGAYSAGLRFSPDGRYLLLHTDASVGYSVCEAETGLEVFAMPGSMGPAFLEGIPAAFSSDSSLVAAANGSPGPIDSASVYVCDPRSGRERTTLNGLKGQASALAVAPDGKTLALARSSGPTDPHLEPAEIVVWTVGQDKAPRSFRSFADTEGRGANWLGYSPDGRLLAAANHDAGVAVWDAATGADRWKAAAAGELVQAAAFSRDGRLLAGASQPPQAEEGHIRLWETASGKVRREFTGHFGPVTSLAFSPDGGVLASGCQDTTILLWDATGMKAAEVEGQKELKADVLDALWSDLASADAVTAGRAVARLAVAPADAVPYLKKQVRPVEGKPTDEAAIVQRVADLDADEFGVRERAQRDLAEIGAAATPALRKALAGAPPPELKRRAEELLAKLAKPDLSAETLRQRRAVEALERAGTSEAREWLEALAKGKAEADVTEDACAAVKRLAKRP